MKTITRATLIDTIQNHKGCTFMTIHSDTDARLLKTGNPYKEVRKIASVNVAVGFDYTSAVNKQLTREDAEAEFVAKPRRWGTRIDLKTVNHKGKTYLTYKGEKVLNVKYMCGGLELQKDSIKAFFPKKKKSTTQGTTKEIIYRDLDSSNITGVTMFGENYIIV